MGYRKFSEEREAKRGDSISDYAGGRVVPPTRQQEVELARALDYTDIRKMVAAGEPLFSHVIRIYGYNKVVRATEPAPGRRQRKRRSYGQDIYDGE